MFLEMYLKAPKDMSTAFVNAKQTKLTAIDRLVWENCINLLANILIRSQFLMLLKLIPVQQQQTARYSMVYHFRHKGEAIPLCKEQNEQNLLSLKPMAVFLLTLKNTQFSTFLVSNFFVAQRFLHKTSQKCVFERDKELQL